MTNRYFVSQNGHYQVVTCDNDKLPDGSIADVTEGMIYTFPNGIHILKTNRNGFSFYIKKHCLLKMPHSNPVCVIDHMNYYSKLTKEEIWKLKEEQLEPVKTELELEVQGLLEEKQNLEQSIASLKRIYNKLMVLRKQLAKIQFWNHFSLKKG